MRFSYNKLWKILNEPVQMEILARICHKLDCNIGDTLAYGKEDSNV